MVCKDNIVGIKTLLLGFGWFRNSRQHFDQVDAQVIPTVAHYLHGTLFVGDERKGFPC